MNETKWYIFVELTDDEKKQFLGCLITTNPLIDFPQDVGFSERYGVFETPIKAIEWLQETIISGNWKQWSYYA